MESRSAEDCFFEDHETAACVDEGESFSFNSADSETHSTLAHRHGMRVCSHARARDAVIQCAKHGVDVIYHGMYHTLQPWSSLTTEASYTDELGMKLLEEAKHRLVVAPAINWLYTTVHEATPFGYTFEKAEQVGYKKELEIAIKALKEMHKRGITVLP